MKIKTNSLRRELKKVSLIYFVAFTIYMVAAIARITFFINERNVWIIDLSYMTTLLLLIFFEAIQMKMESIRELIGFGILLLLFTPGLFNGEMSIGLLALCNFALIFSARRINFDKVCRLSLFISAITLTLVVVCSLTGLIKDYVFRNAILERHCLGFKYPLYPACLLFNITALVVYIKKQNIRFLKILLLFASNYFIYYYTHSRVSFFCSSVLIIFATVMKIKKTPNLKNKVVTKILCWSYVVVSIISIIITWNYDSSRPWMAALNVLSETRLYYGSLSLKRFGVVLLGKPQGLFWTGGGLDINGQSAVSATRQYLFVDNMYVNYLQSYGVIMMVLFIIAITYMLFMIRKKNDSYLLVILAVIAFRGIIDNLSMYIHYNTFFLVIGIFLNVKELRTYRKSISINNKRVINNYRIK